MSPCACMGPRPGSNMCYCQLKAAGLPTTEYEWSQETIDKMEAVLRDCFGWKGEAKE